MTKPKHPDGMTVGTFTSTEAGNEIEFFICEHCLNAKHPLCTGLAWDRSYGERHLYSCECESKADGYKQMTPEQLGLSICKGCGRAIDPTTCGCGDDEKSHGIGSGHPFIPQGCDCYRVKSSDVSKA